MEATTNTTVATNEGGVDVDAYDDATQEERMISIIDDDVNIVIAG